MASIGGNEVRTLLVRGRGSRRGLLGGNDVNGVESMIRGDGERFLRAWREGGCGDGVRRAPSCSTSSSDRTDGGVGNANESIEWFVEEEWSGGSDGCWVSPRPTKTTLPSVEMLPAMLLGSEVGRAFRGRSSP